MDGGHEHTLAFLLAFDRRLHWYEQGYHARFAIRQVPASNRRPHGLNYSLTLHGPDGERIMGFDNAHAVARRGRHGKRETRTDHWHRSGDDPGRPYAFVDAETLIAAFFAEVERVLTGRGVPLNIVRDDTRSDEDKP